MTFIYQSNQKNSNPSFFTQWKCRRFGHQMETLFLDTGYRSMRVKTERLIYHIVGFQQCQKCGFRDIKIFDMNNTSKCRAEEFHHDISKARLDWQNIGKFNIEQFSSAVWLQNYYDPRLALAIRFSDELNKWENFDDLMKNPMVEQAYIQYMRLIREA